MKVIKAIVSIVVALGLIAGGVFVYRSCSSCGAFSCAGSLMTVYAAEKDNSVLADLQKDSAFKASDYPENAADYSLQLIQIAESTDGKLFVYVYQPSGEKVTGTSINISTAINDSLKYTNYKLSLVSSAGTLFKYRVEDFAVKADTVRYYEISNILRKWDESIDKKPTDDNTISEVPNAVGRLWTACTVDGNVTYSRIETETIVVTDKHVGFVRYEGGFNLTYNACDSHYVAFSTDRDMERLMEADVYFVTRGKTEIKGLGHGVEYKDPTEQYVYLTYDQEASNPPYGLFAHKYTWNRIESITAFTSREDTKLTDETKTALAGKQWVLRFYESQFHVNSFSGSTSIISTEVTDVTILRLKFETNGVVYNLGVVDNKQSGDDQPDGFGTKGAGCDSDLFADLWYWIKRIWSFIKANWQWFLLGTLLIVIGSVVIGVIEWGFKQK